MRQAVLSILVVLGITGCGEAGPQGEKGDQGENGLDGTPGLNGENGLDGEDGENGATALISTGIEPAGDNCPDGGMYISYGIDENQNAILDPEEISNTEYICDGMDGEDGQDGQNGQDGASALISVTAEPAGAHCPNGGVAISYGVDSNANGVLDSSEITNTEYVCNGGNGTGSASGVPYFGDLTIGNEAILTAFCGSYQSVYGNLTISGANISSLSELSCLDEVYGNLEISTTSITDLSGLENLVYVDGNLTISDNTALTNFGGLDSLTGIGGNIYAYNNTALTDISAMDSITSISAYEFGNNDANLCDDTTMGLAYLQSVQPSVWNYGYCGTSSQLPSLNPDYILFSSYNVLQANAIGSVIFPNATNPFSGLMSIILYDSVEGDYCALDWYFDAATSSVDLEFADGLVTNAFTGSNMSGWYGYTINSSPSMRGACYILDSSYATGFATLQNDVPGIGFGPLTSNLQSSLSTETNWSSIQGSVFTGIVSITLGGSRLYMDLNYSFAYPIVNGVPSWSSNATLPQGTEIPIGSLPSANGFYVSNYYFGLNAGMLQ